MKCPDCNVLEWKTHKDNCPRLNCLNCGESFESCKCVEKEPSPFIPINLPKGKTYYRNCGICTKEYKEMFIDENWDRACKGLFPSNHWLCEGCFDKILKIKKLKRKRKLIG